MKYVCVFTIRSLCKSVLLIFLFLLSVPHCFGQEDRSLDGMKKEYLKKDRTSKAQYELLKSIIEESPNIHEKLQWADTLMKFAIVEKNPKYKILAHMSKAWAYSDLGKHYLDIKETLSAMEISDSIGENSGSIYNHLAGIYQKVSDTGEAIKYYHKSISLYEKADTINYPQLVSSYYNYSDFFLKMNMLDSAYLYLEKAMEATKKTSPELSSFITPFLEGNLGVYYLKQGQYSKAVPLIEKSAEEIIATNPDGAVEYYNYLTNMAQEQGDMKQALNYANRAMEIAEATNATSKLADTHLNLYEIEKTKGNATKALEHYIIHQEYKDSLLNLSSIQEMYNMNKNYEVASVQKEVDLMEKEAEIQELRAYRSKIISFIAAGAVILLLLLIFGLFNRFKYIRKTSRIIEQEKERSDQLLRNILPDETATELKINGKVKAKQFESVSVLFADFCGFTKFSASMEPQALVERVDHYFSQFDKIMETYQLEKIKTIGDAYMCAGGLPFARQDHAERLVKAAFDMLEVVKKVKNEDPNDPTRFDIRIGINTGPVVAGVVGTKKFVYDIWGDTVNIASRMETNSEAGQINVSENTYQLIKDTFECSYRGMVDVKHKGMMKMYFVNPISEAF
ncbi:adenylate/guanylate cyclase domain-containing protein [Robertkochia sediminum]|uniref:adenylate/guanylate cyclase domain-containing protein n=1 Tax=Robertkochia sediminum TaxID=2785326 RepID=UPI001932477F|nr:adenylate/guanylate cyclase domain-containing protein [Robertkochia sediminum]MBL7473366.1 tetratricopeptide repeat protein [Robertkochia sediminum]